MRKLLAHRGMASFNAKDALTDAPLAVKDGAIRLSFSGMSYRMVEIRQ
jgi:hypothetical protein